MIQRDVIRAQARAMGFDAVGFARAETSPQAKQDFAQFLAEDRHGDMAWMTTTADRRADPKVLWPAARTAIMLGVNYGPADDPRKILKEKDRGAISVYAQNRDYHDVIKKRLKQFASWLAAESGAEVKVFVDTAPVLEKPLAQAAGLGWQGKHTNLVSRDFGSWLFLGEVFTTLDLEPDAPDSDHCGSCRACLDICPTQAFTGAREIDARRCISYLTIEHKGPIARELRPLMGNRIYGCDDCLAVCPWNKFAAATAEPAFLPRAALSAPRLTELARLTDATFRDFFSGSPIKRIGRDRFVRNVLIAIGNSADSALQKNSADSALQKNSADSALQKNSADSAPQKNSADSAPQKNSADSALKNSADRSLSDIPAALLADSAPVVRGAAVWALRRLADAQTVDALRTRYRAAEPDETVVQEWDAPDERRDGAGFPRQRTPE